MYKLSNIYLGKYTVIHRNQNTGQHFYLKSENKPSARVQQFQYLGTTLTNQNFIQEDIRNRLTPGNAFCDSVQKRLSSSLINKNIKVKIYRTKILPVVLHGCETWSLVLREAESV